jgi:hypothetical protein
MVYDKIKHLVEVDERILAVFVVDSTSQIRDVFIAHDAKIDISMVETVKSELDIKLKMEKQVPLGKHLWDVSEYDKIRIIRIYDTNQITVVLCKSHVAPGEITDAVIGYLYESDEQPVSLF